MISGIKKSLFVIPTKIHKKPHLYQKLTGTLTYHSLIMRAIYSIKLVPNLNCIIVR